MEDTRLYFAKPSCWAPGMQTEDDWTAWAEGTKEIERTEEAPKLTFTPPLFRRRLSQLSRMTVQVVHDTLERTGCGDCKQAFASLRGEIRREYEIDEMLIKENDVSPAAFSLSVFNAPVALASIACGLKSGYSVLFPAKEDFSACITAACAPVLCGDESRILFIYGDELVPEQYGPLRPESNEPLAFATVISAQPAETAPSVRSTYKEASFSTPSAFLRFLLQGTRL